MKTLTALLLALGLGFAQPSLSLEEAQNAARFCYGAAAGLSYRMVGAMLAGTLPDGMSPLRFDCIVEEYQGGLRVVLYLDSQPIEDSAAWLRLPPKPSEKTGEGGGHENRRNEC